MKINVILKTESNEKLNVLLKMAYEMGMHVQIGDTDLSTDDDAEFPVPDEAQLQYSKAAFLAETPSQQKINLLADVAKAMGIRLFPVPDDQLEDSVFAQHSLQD